MDGMGMISNMEFTSKAFNNFLHIGAGIAKDKKDIKQEPEESQDVFVWQEDGKTFSQDSFNSSLQESSYANLADMKFPVKEHEDRSGEGDVFGKKEKTFFGDRIISESSDGGKESGKAENRRFSFRQIVAGMLNNSLYKGISEESRSILESIPSDRRLPALSYMSGMSSDDKIPSSLASLKPVNILDREDYKPEKLAGIMSIHDTGNKPVLAF